MKKLYREGTLYELYLGLAIVFMCLCNVYSKKAILISGSFYIAASGILFPIVFFFIIIINEVYGHKQCGKAISIILLCQLIFIISLWWSSLIPAPHISSKQIILNNAYSTIFSQYGQVVLGGMLGVGFALYFFSSTNSFLKIKLCSSNIYLRFLISIAFSKAILVIIAYFINFWGIVDTKDILKICLNTWIVKVLLSFASLFISIPIIKATKKRDKIDIYDIGVKYNPIYLYTNKSEGVNMYEENIKG